MLGKIASQLAHPENESYLSRATVIVVLHALVTFDAILGTSNRFGKCNDKLKQ